MQSGQKAHDGSCVDSLCFLLFLMILVILLLQSAQSLLEIGVQQDQRRWVGSSYYPPRKNKLILQTVEDFTDLKVRRTLFRKVSDYLLSLMGYNSSSEVSINSFNSVIYMCIFFVSVCELQLMLFLYCWSICVFSAVLCSICIAGLSIPILHWFLPELRHFSHRCAHKVSYFIWTVLKIQTQWMIEDLLSYPQSMKKTCIRWL